MASTRNAPEQDQVPPKSDAYTGILGVSLIALAAGSAFLYLDMDSYPESNPPAAPQIQLKSTDATADGGTIGVDAPAPPVGGVNPPQDGVPPNDPNNPVPNNPNPGINPGINPGNP